MRKTGTRDSEFPRLGQELSLRPVTKQIQLAPCPRSLSTAIQSACFPAFEPLCKSLLLGSLPPSLTRLSPSCSAASEKLPVLRWHRLNLPHFVCCAARRMFLGHLHMCVHIRPLSPPSQLYVRGRREGDLAGFRSAHLGACTRCDSAAPILFRLRETAEATDSRPETSRHRNGGR